MRGVRLEVGVGSSCNACAEVDPTRATVQAMNLDGSAMETKAKRFRNPIAMALDDHGVVWAGGAGQDNLAQGHPYEFLDPVSTHPAPPTTAGRRARRTTSPIPRAPTAARWSSRRSSFPPTRP